MWIKKENTIKEKERRKEQKYKKSLKIQLKENFLRKES